MKNEPKTRFVLLEKETKLLWCGTQGFFSLPPLTSPPYPSLTWIKKKLKTKKKVPLPDLSSTVNYLKRCSEHRAKNRRPVHRAVMLQREPVGGRWLGRGWGWLGDK